MLFPILIPGLVACVSPADRLDDFSGRVMDAGTDRVDAEVLSSIPDVSGQFLYAMDPSVASGSYFRFVATVETFDITTDTPKVAVTLQPLDAETWAPVGDPITSVESPVAVALTGEFTLEYDNAVVPAETNAVSKSEVEIDLVVDAIIQGEDEFCGISNGGVVAPFTLSLDGSTMGAVRIPDGSGPRDVALRARCP